MAMALFIRRLLAALAVSVAVALAGGGVCFAAPQAVPAVESVPLAPRIPREWTDAAAHAPVDLSTLAQQYERLRKGPSGATEARGGADPVVQGLLIFVSLGMPEASLQRLVADAARARATLVLRGVLGGSLKASRNRMAQLVGEHRVVWQIDPSLFKRFAVTAVPTYVLIDPARPVQVACGQALCEQATFTSVAGDVSAAHALEAIGRSEPGFTALVASYRRRIGGTP